LPLPTRAGLGVRATLLARTAALALVGGFGVAVFLRFWHIDALGFNSDETVYGGQGASIANVHAITPYFPIFRAHPLLFQTLLSLGYRAGGGDVLARLLASAFGLGTIAVVFLIGRTLYDRRTGLLAALFLALMPYDVLVSRQVLLDGPATFFAALTLYTVAKFSVTRNPSWLRATGAAMGLTVLSKETNILTAGALYVFFALSPDVGARLRSLAGGLVVMLLVVAAYPIAIHLAGHSQAGQQYLAYQLFRRPNHQWTFYPASVPPAIGWGVVAAALAGLWLLRSQSSWRETLLLSWIVVPTLFFQLYPVKGFQYLLPTAPAFALLAARTLGRWRPRRAVWLPSLLAAAVAASLALATWQRLQPSRTGVFIAGTGGLPHGRELGRWIADSVPAGAEIVTIGPSTANIVEFYGQRRAYGLSVGPNPLKRNPAYDPIPNPDLAIRSNVVQYLVWDAYTATRTPFFANKLLRYARRYHGRAVHTESIPVRTHAGATVLKPIFVVYSVRR
jgi:4-amino-4-deoxy-L-arabinose transferase-like glycosyltransferase